MASYNGLVSSLTLNGSTTSQTLTVGAVTYSNTAPTVPAKFFSSGQFAVSVSGASGTVGVLIVGAVGGATFVIAGRTNISAAGGFPIPMLAYVGTSGTVPAPNPGIPRPAYVQWGNGSGSSAAAGITASVFFAGEYN